MAIIIDPILTVTLNDGSITTPINISAPSGIALNDLLVMFVDSSLRSSYPVVVSGGWTLHQLFNGVDGTSSPEFPGVNYTGLYYKYADSADVSLSNSSGFYTISRTEATNVSAYIVKISGAAVSSNPFAALSYVQGRTAPSIVVPALNYQKTLKNSCVRLLFASSSVNSYAEAGHISNFFIVDRAKQWTDYNGLLYNPSVIVAYTNPIPINTNLTNYTSSITTVLGSRNFIGGVTGIDLLIEPFTPPKYIMRELYDANGNPYANGTQVYCASETDPTDVITGTVGSWVGEDSFYSSQNVALPYGGVGFSFDSLDTDRKFIYIKPNVDEYGLISEYITPTQLQ